MGALGGFLGLNGGFNGTGAMLTPGTDVNQLGQANAGVQGALGNQQALLQALQGQNGIGNQSQVYGQLQNIAAGKGPNPAQAMLNQTTGQNVANQAALMAGQRGAGANAGLIARQAAQQGAGIQQNAAGQAATLQAQQAMNAINSAGNIAGQQVGNQLAASQEAMRGQLAQQQALQNANAAYNQVQIEGAKGVQGGQQGAIGGLLGGAGGLLGLAEGGDVPSDASKGPQSYLGKFLSGTANSMGTAQNPLQAGMSSFLSGVGKGVGKLLSPSEASPIQLGSQFNTPAPSLGVNAAPGQSSNFAMPKVTLPPMAKGGNVGSKLKGGGKVPGEAKKAGNSYQNDTVKALLSPGEGVIDRETMQHPGAVGDAARFVMAYVNSKKRGSHE